MRVVLLTILHRSGGGSRYDMMETGSAIVGVCDVNGIFRGKRVPLATLDKAQTEGVRLPLSIVTVDVWGRDIDGNDLVFDSGDVDGVGRAFGPALDNPGGAFLPLWLFNEAGAPHPCCPRQALARVVDRYAARGWRPVVATELEFYLTGGGFAAPDVLSVDALEAQAPFLDAVYATCAANGVPADAAISEGGPGQFEINLMHRDDPLAAADHAVMFKRIVKSCARAHGMSATFMAKPQGVEAGSGLHVHFSLLDQGRNLFDDGSDAGSQMLRHAVGGLTAAMEQTTLIFAPHFNSFRRLRPDSHAPTTVAWGVENRTAAIRIPGGSTSARRIEHRVAGADANPYLVLAAVLGAALVGIDGQVKPPAPVVGNAAGAGAPLPTDWAAAIDAFAAGDVVANVFDPMFVRLFADTKRQELSRFLDTVTPFEIDTYQAAL